MGDHEHGHARLGQVLHDGQHLAYGFRVQRTGWLIEKHQGRFHGQCACDGYALLLAAGKLIGVAVAEVAQPYAFQVAQGDFLRLGLLALEHLDRRNGAVFQHRQVREQVELLEDHAHLLAHLVQVHIGIGGVEAADHDGAAIWLLQQVHAAQQGGLSRAGRTDQADHLARSNIQVNALEHFVAAVGLAQSGDFHARSMD